MTLLDKLVEFYSQADEELLRMDGFDDAVIGIDEHSMRLIYSRNKILEILQKDMSEIDALEYFEFNIHCAYVGEKTPIICLDDI